MNMSYCRFTNTRADLSICLDSIRQDKHLSDFEADAGKMMFQEFLAFLAFCRDYDIIDSYDRETIGELFDGLQEGGV